MVETRSSRVGAPAGTLVRVGAGLGGLFYLVTGLWAFFAPRSFYDAVATFPPYSVHFIHDLGAFAIGLAAVLLLGLVWSDALLATLAGVAIGSAMHFVSHVLDADLGGLSITPWATGAFALLLLAAAWARWKEVSR